MKNIIKDENHLNKVELLAPAGNLEKLEFAIRYGADAVYLGGQQFGLRSKAGNFSFDDMDKGIDFAHKNGAKVYVAMNIIAHDEDLKGLEDYLYTIKSIDADAIIVADPAIISIAKKTVPDLDIHLSTQASTTNWRSVQFWKNEGLTRVVLARELSLLEIREIKDRVDIELETFIHGAMCNSYSGRCVLSNHMTNRDANRGGCAQSCRWNYDLFKSENNDIPLFKEGDNPYTMSSKDLNMVDKVDEIIEAGIDSLKIEGRMKSIHYVATIVNTYRHAIDMFYAKLNDHTIDSKLYDEVLKASHRPIFNGFYYKPPSEDGQIYGEEPKIRRYDFVGMVLDYDMETKTATIQQRNNFKVGQEIEFFGPDTKFMQTINYIEDKQGNSVEVARHPLQIIKVKVDNPVKIYDMMRKEN